ncbi:PadR family transcriptional regulator [Methanobacterium alcaliphilum]|uniref:PadR family transcriptional regulator n=1 Tax=Methanobacterium alcaliphilum TaxID=392018 RepID=UPI002009E74F|nr:MarR family winged helix-turn-helix transcriptional regulator [Methanobacterium alcaliphilum]MCK9151043.1 MarR family winged helix-turn-helix transcriptional regulator [Methanobacterium alcaliphilum]
MVKISNQETAVLGLLFEHHHYAYRIEEIMGKRGMDAWVDIDYSNINNILKELESKKLVKSSCSEDDQSKTIYHITNEGKSLFKKSISSILSKKEKLISSFDLGLANMFALSEDELIPSLENYLKSLDENIRSLEYAVEFQEKNNIPINFIAIFKRSISILRAEKIWLIDFIAKIQSRDVN